MKQTSLRSRGHRGTRHERRGNGAAAGRPPELQIVHVRGNVYMLAGAGGNITLSVGRTGS